MWSLQCRVGSQGPGYKGFTFFPLLPLRQVETTGPLQMEKLRATVWGQPDAFLFWCVLRLHCSGHRLGLCRPLKPSVQRAGPILQMQKQREAGDGARISFLLTFSLEV